MAGLYEYDDDNKVVDEEEAQEERERQEQEAEANLSPTPPEQMPRMAMSKTSTRRDDGTYTTAPQPRNEAAEAILNNNNKTQGYYSFLDEWKNTSPIESDADYEKRRKRARNAALFSAIGDGISSLANLYATTRYAPSAYNANTPTMTGKVLERYDKMEEQRQKDKATWAAGMQKARQLDNANAKDTRNYLLKLAQQQRQEEREAAKEERAKAKDEREEEKMNWKREDRELDNKLKQSKIDNADRIASATVAKLRAQAGAANRSNRGRSDGSGKEPKVVYTPNGVEIHTDPDMYKQAVETAAQSAGIDLYGTVDTTDPLTGLPKRTRYKKGTDELAGELRNRYGTKVVADGAPAESSNTQSAPRQTTNVAKTTTSSAKKDTAKTTTQEEHPNKGNVDANTSGLPSMFEE